MAGIELFDGSMNLLRQGMTGLATRQQLIANNLANVDTPGYRSYEIPFERVLENQVKRQGEMPMAATAPGHISLASTPAQQAVAAQQHSIFRSDGNGVDVDAEMARLSETGIEYNVLAQLLSTRIAIMRSAVSEGRR